MAGTPNDTVACPGDEALSALLASDAPELVLHLDECSHCRERLDALAGDVGEIGEARETERPDELQRAIEFLARHPLDHERELVRWLKPSESPGVLGTLGGYEVRRLLFEGGMGLVLEAFDPMLDRVVAIKFIKPHHTRSKTARERMLREARAVAAINHDCVVPIYAAEIDENSSSPYFVMPLVSGGTLEDLLKATDGPLPMSEVIDLGIQIARGLEAAHSSGVLHRDIKPANILLPGDGRVWLADFGIARASDDQRLTSDGELSGTPQFMSPEQINGKPVDERADLFSLGGVLYQIATGSSAFDGDSSVAVIRSVADGRHQSGRKRNPKMPQWFSDLLDQLLEKQPEKRPQSAAEVIEILEGQSNRRLIRRRRVMAVTIAALGCLLLAGLYWRPANAWKESPIVLPEQRLGFGSLSEAIAAAEPGGVIVLRSGGVIHRGPLGSIDKPLVLRADAVSPPVILSTDPDTPVLEVNAPLVIEGIKIWNDSNLPLTASVIRANAPFFAANCGILKPKGDQLQMARPASIVEVAAPVDLVNCAMYTGRERVIGLARYHDVVIRNCFLAGFSGIYMHECSEGPAVASLRMERFVFLGRELLRCNHETKRLHLDLVRGMIDSRSVIAMQRGDDLGNLKKVLTLRENENLFGDRIVSFVSDGVIRRGRVFVPDGMDLKGWNELWGMEESRSLVHPLGLQQRLKVSKYGERWPDGIIDGAAYTDRGVDSKLGGVGESYHRYRETDDYRDWLERAMSVLEEWEAK